MLSKIAVFAQKEECGFTQFEKYLLNSRPELLKVADYQEKIYLKEFTLRNFERNNGEELVIPLVFHLIQDNFLGSVLDEEVIRAVDYLNLAFANQSFYDRDVGVNTKIKFCLARQQPDGYPTSGITRMVNNLYHINISPDDQALKNLVRWDTKSYANVWVVGSINGGSVAGYAYLPGSHGSQHDGIVVVNSVIKDITNYGHTTLVHEFGHYLGLYHTFEGGCRNNDCLTHGDRVCDTPPDATTIAPGDCSAIINSCSTDSDSGFATDQNDINWNYLDYGNRPCRSGFTLGQAERMRFFLKNHRTSLLESRGCFDPCASELTSRFTILKDTFIIGENIIFTNESFNAENYSWFINGEEYGQERDFSYAFTESGTYRISLITHAENGLCIQSYAKIIFVVCPVMAVFSTNNSVFRAGESLIAVHDSNEGEMYQWYVNGVYTSDSNQLNYLFSTPADYEIRLKIYHEDFPACYDESITIIKVNCGAIADFQTINVFPALGENIIFENGSTGAASFLWMVNEEVTSTDFNFESAFSISGNFSICLSASDAFCMNTICKNIFVIDTLNSGCDKSTLNTYGTPGMDEGSRIIEWGNGYIIAGTVNSNVGILYISDIGEIIWSNEFNVINGETESVQDMILDNNFLVILGNSSISSQSFKNFVIKFDLNLKSPVWTQSYEGTQFNQSYFIRLLNDRLNTSYMLFGQTQPNQPPGSGCDAAWIKINAANGSLVDLNNFTLGSCETFTDATLSDNNRIYAVGRFNASGGGTNRMRGSITRLDINGNEIWSKLYTKNIQNTDARLYFSSVIESENALYTAGFGDLNGTSTTNVDILLLKTDLDGNLLWQNTYNIINANSESIKKMISMPDGLLLFGDAIFNTGRKLFLIKTDKNGKLIWQAYYGTGENERAGDIIFSNGNLIMTGATINMNSNADILFARMDREGNLTNENCNFRKLMAVDYSTSVNPYEGRVTTTAFKNNYTLKSKNLPVNIPQLEKNTICKINCVDTCKGGYLLDSVPDLVPINANGYCKDGYTYLRLTICNQGKSTLPVNGYITIYNQNPNSPTASILVTLPLDNSITPLKCEDFEFRTELQSETEYYIIVNDNGNNTLPLNTELSEFTPHYPECMLDNNFIVCSLNFSNSPKLDLGPDIVLCPNGITEVKVNQEYSNYLWSTGENTPLITAYIPGLYSIAVTDACGRIQRDSINVTYSQNSKINLPDTIKVCTGDSVALELNGFEEYQWFPMGFIECHNCSNIILKPLKDTLITVVAKSENGCYSYGKSYIRLMPISLDTSEIKICSGDSIFVADRYVKEPGVFTVKFQNIFGCDSVHTFQIETFTDTIRNSYDFILCEGDSILFNNIWFKDEGIFLMENTNSNCTEINTLSLKINPPFTQELNFNICPGDSLSIFGQNVHETGSFTYRKSNNLACDSIFFVNIFSSPPLRVIYETKAACPNGNNGHLKVTPQSGINTIQLFLNGVKTSENNFSNLAAGFYQLKLIDENNCIYDTTILVGVQASPEVDFEIFEPVCAGQSNGRIKLLNEGYLVSSSDNFENPGIVIDSISAGNLHVYFKTSAGCLWDTLLTVEDAPTISLFLPSEITIISGNEYQIRPVHNLINATYHWHPANGLSCYDCPSPIARPSVSTEYFVTITDERGCRVTGNISVLVESTIFISTIFRPGSTYGNDLFVIRSNENIGIVEMKIFDRWGNLVFSKENFETNDASYGWDGMHNGKRSESGVYVGFLKFRNFSGNEVMLTFNVAVIH